MAKSIDIFSKNYSISQLKRYNKLLTDTRYSIDERIKLFKITVFLDENNCFKEEDEFINFCSYVESLDHNEFSKLIRHIMVKLDAVDDNSKECDLCRRLKTITHSANKLSLDTNEYFGLLEKILGDSFSSILRPDDDAFNTSKEELICSLFDNQSKFTDKKRFMFVLNTILSSDVDILLYNIDLVPNSVNIILDDSLASLGDSTYKKALELSFDNIFPYVLDMALQKMSSECLKKKYAIDYYYIVLRNYLYRYNFCNLSTVETHLNKPIFNIPFSPKFLCFDDEEYHDKLMKIASCKNPFTAANVLIDERIDDSKENLLLELLNTGASVKSDVIEIYGTDNKSLLGTAALSDTLLNQSDDDYEEILKMINKNIDASHNDPNNRDAASYEKASGISKLLKCGLYKDKWDIALYLIDKIDRDNELSSTDLGFFTDILSHENIEYYSLDDIKMIYQILRDSDYSYLVKQLFTNKIVPFLEDKTKLFDIAMSNDDKYMKEENESFDKKGSIYQNQWQLLNGTGNGISNMFGCPELKKIMQKKLLSNFN